MQDNITIPKEQLDLMVTKANMELIARLDTLITRLEQQHTKKEWVDLDPADFDRLEQLFGNKVSNDFVFADIVCVISAKLKEKNCE